MIKTLSIILFHDTNAWSLLTAGHQIVDVLSFFTNSNIQKSSVFYTLGINPYDSFECSVVSSQNIFKLYGYDASCDTLHKTEDDYSQDTKRHASNTIQSLPRWFKIFSKIMIRSFSIGEEKVFSVCF